jgi:phage-related protein
VGNAFINGFNSIKTEIYNLGRDIVKGLWDGIKSMTSWLYDQVKGFFKGLIGAGRDATRTHSPSILFRDLGRDIVAGLALGLEDANNLTVPVPSMAAVKNWQMPSVNFPSQAPSLNYAPPSLAQQAFAMQGGTASPSQDININGPITVKNIGRHQDVNSALGDLAFGIQGQLRRRGVYT